MPYKNILLSIDCRGDERKVIDEAIDLSSFCEAKLSIVVINDPGAGKARMMMDTLPRVTEQDVVDQLQVLGYHDKVGDIEIQLIDSESYAQAIAQATENFDLLIMGHHPKNLVVAFLKDSTDEQVADRIDCPILLVPLK